MAKYGTNNPTTDTEFWDTINQADKKFRDDLYNKYKTNEGGAFNFNDPSLKGRIESLARGDVNWEQTKKRGWGRLNEPDKRFEEFLNQPEKSAISNPTTPPPITGVQFSNQHPGGTGVPGGISSPSQNIQMQPMKLPNPMTTTKPGFTPSSGMQMLNPRGGKNPLSNNPMKLDPVTGMASHSPTMPTKQPPKKPKMKPTATLKPSISSPTANPIEMRL